MKTQKLGIIGLGNVGYQVLTNAVQSGLFGEIVTLDIKEGEAYGKALDQAHATGFYSRSNINIYSGDYHDLKDADIIIVALTYSYAPEPVPADRQALIGNNVSEIRSCMSDLTAVTKEPILIFITNPVDTVTYIAQTEFDYPMEKILSTGCMLDTARLKYLIGQHYDLDPKSVNGYMMGEHGYTAFPVLSRTSVGGIAFNELSTYFPHITPLDAEDLNKKVVEAAYEVFHARSGITDAGVAQAAIELSRSILLDERTIHPVASVFKDGEYGFDEPTVFSVPTIIGRKGIIKRLLVELNEWESEKLKLSNASIQDNIKIAQEINT